MADTEHGPHQGHQAGPPEWDAELDIPAIVKGFVWTLVIVALSFVAMWFLYAGLKNRLVARDPSGSPLMEAQVRQVPAEPRLQSTAEADLAAVRAQEAQILGQYGLVEGAPGTARIPIERAMELYVQKHGGSVSAPVPALATPPAPAAVVAEPVAAPHGGSGH